MRSRTRQNRDLLLQYPGWKDPALPAPLRAERYRGFSGTLIAMHRAMAVEPSTRGKRIGNLLLLAATLGVWALVYDPVTLGWVRVLDFWQAVFGMGGYALRLEYEWGLRFPYLGFPSSLPGPWLWLLGALVTAALFIGSLFVPRRFLPIASGLRVVAFFQLTAQVFFLFWPEAFPYGGAGYVHGMLVASLCFITLVPILLAFTYYVFDFGWRRKLGLTALVMGYLIVFVPLQLMLHAVIIYHLSVLFLPLLFFVFGLPLILMIFIGLYGWAMSWPSLWQPGPVPAVPARPAAAVTTLLLALAAGLPTSATAQQPPAPRWQPTLVFSTDYGNHDGGEGLAQAVILYLAKPDRYWVFSAGHRHLMGEAGIGAGVSYQRTWKQRYRLGGGISSGYNERGGLFPRYQVGVSAGMNVVKPLVAFVDYTHRQSTTDASHGDRFGTSLTWYAPGPWILGARAAYGIGQPGSRASWSGGGGISYSVWEKWSAGVRVDYGDGSYVALPSHQVVEFQSWSYSASVAKYLTRRMSVRTTVGHSDYYGGYTLGFSVAKRW